MCKSSKIAFLCAALALTITLAGCGSKAPSADQESNKAVSQNYNPSGVVNSGGEAEQLFEDTVEVELPDSPVLTIEKKIRPLIKEAFGDLKVSSYFNDTYGQNSMIVTYTISRLPEPGDLGRLSKIIKDNGYKATMENNTGGQVVTIYVSKDYDFSVNFATNQPQVNISYYPHAGGSY